MLSVFTYFKNNPIRIYLRMKYLLIILVFYFQNSFGQADTTINIQELGWTMRLPYYLKVIDTTILNAENRSLHVTWIKKPPADSNRSFNKSILVARDSSRQTMFSISYIDSLHDPLNGEFPEDALRVLSL
jgi:hypothetical protein